MNFQAHTSIEKACNLAMVRLRPISTTRAQNFGLQGPELEYEIQKDLERGLIPFFVQCNLGTTATTAFDNLEGISQICKK